MVRRCSCFSGSAVLSLIVLQSLVVPSLVHGGSGHQPFGIAGPIAAEKETTAGSTCTTSVIVHGYECQEFEVTTEDGYILSLQRIPKGRNGSDDAGNRRPVILQHGVLMDGRSWLLNYPEQNLPFVLAENGFDVWLANSRGTSSSRTHTRLHPLSQAFWDWSWDELMAYDLPAMFDFVYQQTGRTQKIDYVGHSLGTLIMLASLSEGRLLDKLNSVALLSPVAYLSHITALGDAASKTFLGEVGMLVGVGEFNPKAVANGEFLRTLCKEPRVNCSDLFTSTTGKNCCLNSSSVDLFFKYEPQSTSVKNLVHLSQTVRNGVVSKYSYENVALNLAHYGKVSSPIYNLSNIPRNFPLFMSYGGQDLLSDVRDVQHLLDTIKLHDANKLHVQFVKEYAHLDFVMGFNAKEVVFNSVVSFFKQQN